MRRQTLKALALKAAALTVSSPSHQALADKADPRRDGPKPDAFRPITFPRDHGAHPQSSIEWWYLTAWIDAETAVQATVFRATLGKARASTWGSNQWLMGHAAVIKRGWKKLIHEQAVWRCVDDVARFSQEDLDLSMPGWRFQRHSNGLIAIDIEQGRLGLRLRCRPQTMPQLQGDQGYSQKGPAKLQFSHYYSLPQLRVEADLKLDGKVLGVDRPSGFAAAWFDHEWSNSLLSDDSVGWDWFGLNFLDGRYWMAFRIRDRQGGSLWQSEPGLRLETLQSWRSTASGANYPVALRVHGTFGPLLLQPMVQDQEIDARASTGNRYWEGAVMAYSERGELIGRGYLELTGYDRAMRL